MPPTGSQGLLHLVCAVYNELIKAASQSFCRLPAEAGKDPLHTHTLMINLVSVSLGLSFCFLSHLLFTGDYPGGEGGAGAGCASQVCAQH